MEHPTNTVARWFRSRLRDCAAFAAWLCYGFAALWWATNAWQMATTLITAGLFLFAIIYLINGRGPARAFWASFVLVGLGYVLIITFWGRNDEGYVDDLGTSQCLEWLFRQFNAEVEKEYPHFFPEGEPLFHRPLAPGPDAPVGIIGSVQRTNVRYDPSSGRPHVGQTVRAEARQLPAKASFVSVEEPSSADEPDETPGPTFETTSVDMGGYGVNSSDPKIASIARRFIAFPIIGHCLFAILFGWLAGKWAVQRYCRNANAYVTASSVA